MSATPVLPPQRTRHRAIVDELGSAIVAERLQGTLPVEDILCSQLDVSRGALREAMKELVAKGLVEVRPRTGSRVREESSWNRLDPDVIRWWWAADPDGVGRHVHELRELLEPATAVRAAARASDEERAALLDCAARMQTSEGEDYVRADVDFHIALWQINGNPLLGSIGAALSAVLHHVFLCSATAGRTAAAADLHRALADAVNAGDGAAADEIAQALLAVASADFATARKGNS
ncbi:FadR/GntR family transcriptional regulator [Microbacterium sp. ASV49]|uniref:FCD domain-containing protein n=1 Tax=Microbacterium candidum TaxID=3041922 RepID=A0ABT7MTL1_9MICO|nr:FCD domain-containing protein [Microbacterium sp. ASV49]MDL9977787.1 FCD domain-containing protein [Microbacterium sp. ASV49]